MFADGGSSGRLHSSAVPVHLAKFVTHLFLVLGL